MSFIIDTKTYRKKEIADVLIAYAALIKASANETITLSLELTFNPNEEKKTND